MLLQRLWSGSPSYEGVDWNIVYPSSIALYASFSLLRGSGLKWLKRLLQRLRQLRSPSYEGVDWNRYEPFKHCIIAVLPLTREWIEMQEQLNGAMSFAFSLLRGSGLKSVHFRIPSLYIAVLPLTREWIEIKDLSCSYCSRAVLPLTREWIEILPPFLLHLKIQPFSLLRGSGLKWKSPQGLFYLAGCSPSYEGVDWNVKSSWFISP